MEKFLNNMERKIGRFAIKNLMFYVIGAYAFGAVISLVNPYFYSLYLAIDVEKILKGQVWRLITFVLEPMGSISGGVNLIFFLISMYLYWIIGRNLESAWGAFRFNLYYLSGILLNIIAAFITYAVTKNPNTGLLFGISYINQSLLLAFCAMYPDMQVLLMFIIPIKMKYLGIFYGGIVVLNIVQAAAAGNFMFAISIVVALLNFVLFFFSTKNYRRISPSQMRRRRQFKVHNGGEADVFRTNHGPVARHKCAVCGRTELDSPDLEFRFCSKCEGNYEYCSDHLFTHQHIKNI